MSLSNTTRHPEYAGLQEGDFFRVKGEYGKRFRFIAYLENEQLQRGYIECVEVSNIGKRGPVRTFQVKGEPGTSTGGIETQIREVVRT